MSDGNKILFVPFYHKEDRNFIREIESGLNGNYTVCEESEICVEEKRLLFARATACISMRFHGIAFSLYYGIPCEAICYAPKSKELMREYNLEKYCLELGISSKSCFFREFDLKDEELNMVYQMLWEEKCKENFQNASKLLKSKGEEGALCSLI